MKEWDRENFNDIGLLCETKGNKTRGDRKPQLWGLGSSEPCEGNKTRGDHKPQRLTSRRTTGHKGNETRGDRKPSAN